MGLQEMMAGFDQVEMGGGGVYIEPGNYLLKILEVKNGHAQMGGFDFFLAEFEVVASDNPKFSPGSRVEWMVAFKNPQYTSTYQRDVKQFLYHAFRGFDQTVTEEQINNGVWQLATSQQQPLAGKYVGASAVDVPMRHDKNKMFTRVNYKEWAGPQAGAAVAAPAQGVQA
jgi:hypothetical protein